MYRNSHFRPPWPTSSDSVALMSSSDYDVNVTLTPTRSSEGPRRLTLSRGRPCIVGRASKNKGEIHQASDTNALFDCPVISRQHAELRAHPWSSIGNQVSIVDLGSMHGTKVNNWRLEKNKSMTLRSGDVIQFGERVTRGEDSHDAITVTFHQVQDEADDTLGQNKSKSGSTFEVPNASDEEDSEDPEYDEIDRISVDEDEPHISSSAKTTPEQVKARIGSQENPIQLESVQSGVIDLTDEEHAPLSYPVDKASSLPAKRASDRLTTAFVQDFLSPRPEKSGHTHIFDSNKVIKDSIDKDNSFYESYRARVLGDVVKESIHSTTGASGNNPSIHQLGMSGVLNVDEDGISSPASESDMSEVPEAFGAEDDGNESDGEDRLGSEERLGSEDELDHEDEEDDFDADSLYDPGSYDPVKEPSPELGSDTGFIRTSSPAPENLSGLASSPKRIYTQQPAASQPLPFGRSTIGAPFDPIRPANTLQQAAHGPWNTGPYFHDFRAPAPANFLQSPSNRFQNTPDRFGYLPPPPPAPSVFHAPPPPPPLAPSYFASYGMNGPHVIPPRPQAPPPLSSSPPHLYPYKRYNASHGVPPSDLPISHGSSYAVHQGTSESKSEGQKLKEGDKKKMSIVDILDYDDDVLLFEGLTSMKSSPATGTKRKAEEISRGNEKPAQEVSFTPTHETSPIEDAIKAPAVVVPGAKDPAGRSVVDESVVAEPSSRRRRISAEDDVSTAVAVDTAEIEAAQVARPLRNAARTVAKVAGGAVLGGVATMALLFSSVPDMAIDYLL